MAILSLAVGSAITALAMLVLDRRGAIVGGKNCPNEADIPGGNRT